VTDIARGAGRWRQAAPAWAALVVVYLVWGSTYLAIRVGVRDIPPAALAGIRYVIAGALLYPVALRTGDAPLRKQDRPGARQWAACGVVGLLLLAIGNGGVTLAERTVPSGLAAVLVATVPVWMIVFAVPVRGQRIVARSAVGLVLGLAGVGVLAGVGSASGPASGIAIVLVASASWGLGSVLAGRLPVPRRALLGAAMQMLAGGFVLVIIGLARGDFARFHPSAVAPTSWLALAWLVVPGSILAFTAYGFALSRMPPATVSTYAYVNPVVAVILGVVLLHETLSVREVLGAVLIVGSVVLVLRKPAEEKITTGHAEPDRTTAVR
jgi:drug/metabolite transporter (DMT)-like permease